jgi:proteasome lid subunit RPN8/RPN11
VIPARPAARQRSPPRLAAVLRIDRATYDAVVAHARKDHPDEACGMVAGPAGSDRPERFIPMLNAARSPTFYEFEPHEFLQVTREMDDRDEVAVVIYHSHTATEAYPSRTDVGYASGPLADPDAHYVLVSTRQHGAQTGLVGDEVEFRSYRIVDGEVTEEDVQVVESYLFGHSPTSVVYD